MAPLRTVCLLAWGLVIGLPSGALAQRFVGPHPVDAGGHWHAAGDEHTHPVSVEPGAFVEVGEARVFLGDPVAFGYEGPVYIYRGVHPLPGELEAYCAIGGEHAHAFAPEGAYRTDRDGVHTYRGGLRGGRPMLRPGTMAPRVPRVRTTAPSVAPFWFGGCLVRRDAEGRVEPMFPCRPVGPLPTPARPAPVSPMPVRRFNGPGFSTPPGRAPNPRRRPQ